MTDILHTPMPEADCIAYERMTGVVNSIRGHVMAARWFEGLMANTSYAPHAKAGRENAEALLATALKCAGAKIDDDAREWEPEWGGE